MGTNVSHASPLFQLRFFPKSQCAIISISTTCQLTRCFHSMNLRNVHPDDNTNRILYNVHTYVGGTYDDFVGSCGTLSIITDASLRPIEFDPIPDSPGILRPSRRCCWSSFAIRFMCSLASFSCVCNFQYHHFSKAFSASRLNWLYGSMQKLLISCCYYRWPVAPLLSTGKSPRNSYFPHYRKSSKHPLPNKTTRPEVPPFGDCDIGLVYKTSHCR